MSEPRITIDVTRNERRVYDRLRAAVVDSSPGERSGFRDLALLIPDFVVLLIRLARDPQVPTGAKVVAASTVAYVLSPLELMPEILLGPIGLIDDLIALSLGVSFLVNRVHPDLIRSHWPGQEDALSAMQKVTEWTEGFVTDRLFGLLGRIPGLGTGR